LIRAFGFEPLTGDRQRPPGIGGLASGREKIGDAVIRA
jgi:hypothetical protein